MPEAEPFFNSTTMKGRANSAKATLGVVAAIGLYYKFKPGSAKVKKREIKYIWQKIFSFSVDIFRGSGVPPEKRHWGRR